MVAYCYGFTPLWILMCLIRRVSLPHPWHTGYTDMVLIFIWLIYNLLFEIPSQIPHRLHLYGSSPACIFIRFIRYLLFENVLSHCLHWKGFSLLVLSVNPHMTNMTDNSWKDLPQYLHWYGLYPVWIRMCSLQ